MFKRLFLLFGVNILIVVMISLVLNLLGVKPYLSAAGLNYEALMIFCLVWGFGGAFISLFISKWMAKTMMGVELLTSANGPHGEIVQMVHSFAKRAGLNVMPEVGIYQASEINAFATGPSKNNSLVAVSTGLLNSMNRDEVEGVIAHEVAHIANGDMVTMTLIQGVVNAFVMFLARVAAFFVGQFFRRNDDEESPAMGGLANFFMVMIFELLFGILGSMVVAYFSRWREYRADAGSAKLAGREKMIRALEALKRNYEAMVSGPQTQGAQAMQSLQISSKSSFLALLSTHPDLDDRIAALQKRPF